MNKSVLISIRPEWCEKIALYQKTIEIRKTRPKIEEPFKCYIYETKGMCSVPQFVDEEGHIDFRGRGQVIGEFTCDEIYDFQSEFYSTDNVMNAIYIIAEDEDYPGVPLPTVIATNEEDNENFWICTLSCLTFDEIKKYVGYTRPETTFYGWRISDLIIYDKPKELSEFRKHGFRTGYKIVNDNRRGVVSVPFTCENAPLQRPPQSWCYVEEIS